MSDNSNWLLKRREQLNILQDELLARLQLSGFSFSRSTVSGWENDKHNPPLHDPKFRKALADALEVSIIELLVLAGYEVGEMRHKALSERAADILDHLPESAVGVILNLLEYMRTRTVTVEQAIQGNDIKENIDGNSVIVLDTVRNTRRLVRPEGGRGFTLRFPRRKSDNES